MLVSRDYPHLRIRVSVRNFRSRMRAMVDTGFDGDIVLPHNYLPQLGKPDFHVPTRLADGTEGAYPAYKGGTELIGLDVRVVYLTEVILLGDECLIGRGIINQLKVTFERGSRIVVEL